MTDIERQQIRARAVKDILDTEGMKVLMEDLADEEASLLNEGISTRDPKFFDRIWAIRLFKKKAESYRAIDSR